MTHHVIPNARGRSMLGALAALGLLRVVGEQADPVVRSWYDGFDLHLETSVGDLVRWLAEEYVPTPVLSPWNEGSGYGLKDKEPKRSLAALLSNDDPRLDGFRLAHAAVEPLAAQFRREKWDKGRLVGEVRAVCPDTMVPWLDAAVVVMQDDKLAFPPLLGTGGNDGRLDFSTNFHQRLLSLVGVTGSVAARSVAWAKAWLTGSNDVPLVASAVGQFDPGSAGTPNSSPWGAAESVVNPWQFVLMIEGAMLFASAPARRLSLQAEQRSPRVAMTFTTFGSSAGTETGSAVEQTRGEVWVPWWQRSLSWNAVRSLFTEGRAVWRGQTATSSNQMYLATGARGMTPGVAGFDRFSVAKRNGLAFSAVLVDSPSVAANPMLALVEQTEDWPNRVESLGDQSQAIGQAWRRYDAARTALVRDRGSRPDLRLRDYLGSVTRIEIAVAQSSQARAKVPPRNPLPKGAQELLRLLRQGEFRALLDDSDFRLAVAFASVHTASGDGAPSGRSIRQILLPIDPPASHQSRGGGWRPDSLVPGIGSTPWIDLLAAVAAWCALTPQEEAPGTRTGPGGVGRRERGRLFGVTGPPHGVGAVAADLHRLASASRSDLVEAGRWWMALLALDWHWDRGDASWPVHSPPAVVLDPLLAGLLGFRHGLTAERSDHRADAHDGEADVDVARFGLKPEWFAQLRAGQTERVHRDVTARLRQVGRGMVSPLTSHPIDQQRGRAVAAALLPRCRGWSSGLGRVSRSLRPVVDEDTTITEPPSITDLSEEIA